MEYKKGQELIENVPLDPYYEYKLGSVVEKTEQTKKLIKESLAPKRHDHLDRAIKLRDLPDAYD